MNKRHREFDGTNVLITGGLGFIGSTLSRRLVELGARVTVIDSLIPEYGGNRFNIAGIEDRIDVRIADIRNHEAIDEVIRDKEFLFNLAGQTSHLDSMKNPDADLEINARAQLSILEACRRGNPTIKIVFAGTRQIYGKPDYLPVDEEHPLRPVDVNGINKLAGEMYHILYHKTYGIRTCVLRMTNTYGPRMRVKDARQTFLGIWIRLLLEGQPIKIYGDGTQVRDFNFVDDAVEALLLAAGKREADGEIFNLGNHEHMTLKELAELLVELHPGGRYEQVEFPSDLAAIDIGDYRADFGKIRNKLGWQPRVGLSDGLKRTIEYYAQHGEHYWERSKE